MYKLHACHTIYVWQDLCGFLYLPENMYDIFLLFPYPQNGAKKTTSIGKWLFRDLTSILFRPYGGMYVLRSLAFNIHVQYFSDM